MITKDGIEPGELGEHTTAIVTKSEVELLVGDFEEQILEVSRNEIAGIQYREAVRKCYASRRILDFIESGAITSERCREIREYVENNAPDHYSNESVCKQEDQIPF